MIGIVEKPSFDRAPSNIASIGRYVFNSEIFDKLRKIEYKAGQELQLTDGINSLALEGLVETVTMNGLRFDCGSLYGFVKATEHVYRERYGE